jgi:hypothetical protein
MEKQHGCCDEATGESCDMRVKPPYSENDGSKIKSVALYNV